MLERFTHLLIILVTASTILAGCAEGASDNQTETPTIPATSPVASPMDLESEESTIPGLQPRSAALTEKSLRNTKYKSELITSGFADLEDGEYREPVAPGAASEVIIQITLITYGSLSADLPAAAVIHTSNAGGSGTFYTLSVVVERDGKPSEIGSISLGDRTVINEVGFENGEIMIDLVAHAPDDPMCCPTQHEIRRFTWLNDELVEIERQVVAAPETVSATNDNLELVGVSWRWLQFKEMDDSLTIPDDPSKYNLEFQADGSVNILADCNGGSGAYTSNESLLSIRITRMTMAACPPDSLSDEYVRLLNDAVSYLFEDGDLYIAIKHDTGIMHFAPAQ